MIFSPIFTKLVLFRTAGPDQRSKDIFKSDFKSVDIIVNHRDDTTEMWILRACISISSDLIWLERNKKHVSDHLSANVGETAFHPN